MADANTPDVKRTSGTASAAAENPYLAGRLEWMERYGSLIQERNGWRRFGALATAISLIAVAGMIWTAQQNHFIPYIVEVDRLGAAVAVGRAQQASGPLDQRIIQAQVSRWVVQARSVFVDAAAQRMMIDGVYSMLSSGSEAFVKLNDYFRSASPFQRASKETVTVQVRSALPISPTTWRVEWEEETRDRSGVLVSSQVWEASITIVVEAPKDEAVLMTNPTGLYVTNFSWTKRL